MTGILKRALVCLALAASGPFAQAQDCAEEPCGHHYAESGFLEAQEITLNSASVAFEQMARRHNLSSEFAPLYRLISDLELETGALERLLLKDLQLVERENLRNRLDASKVRLADAKQALGKDADLLAETFGGAPLGYQQVRNLLTDDEALVYFYSASDATYTWIITADRAPIWHRSPTGRKDLGVQVESLRFDLDTGFGLRTGGPAGRIQDPATPRPPYLIAAGALSADLFGEGWDILETKQEIIIVPSGPLLSLSFAALPIPKTGPEDKVQWLGLEKSISVLPTLSALRAFRCEPDKDSTCRSSSRDSRFDKLVAIGAPRLAPPAEAVAKCTDGHQGGSNAVVSPSALMNLKEIPGARAELDAAAGIFGSASSLILKDASATESELRRLDLEDADVLLFPTHGLLGEEAQGISEPGLVFTPPCLQDPPRAPSETDDGFLSASEVLGLKIDAAIVILTACNTASGQGSVGEGLSGLASAFLHAGAKSLLVTHWQVDDEATRLFSVEMLTQMKSDRGRASTAEYARRAAKSLYERGGSFAHPSIWGPFMIIGVDDGRRES